jgi:hypothetical protein
MRRFLILFRISESSMNLNPESSDLLTKSRSPYLGNIRQMRVSEESSFSNLQILWPNLRRLLRKFTTMDESPKNLLSKRRKFGPTLLRLLTRSIRQRTSEHRNVNTSRIQNNPFFTWLFECVRWRTNNNGPFSLIKPSQWPSQWSASMQTTTMPRTFAKQQGQQVLLCTPVRWFANDEITTQPNPLEAFKWT